MRWINQVIDKSVQIFGGLVFIMGFNIFTIAWVYLGLTNKHFFDPFPSNFYTLAVSWWAINMSCMILWSDNKKKAREDKQTLAMMHMIESQQHILKVIKEQTTDILEEVNTDDSRS